MRYFLWLPFFFAPLFVFLQCGPSTAREPASELQIIQEESARLEADHSETQTTQEPSSETPVTPEPTNQETQNDQTSEPTIQEALPPQEQPLETSQPDASITPEPTHEPVSNESPSTERLPEITKEATPTCKSSEGKDLCDDGNPCNGKEQCDLNTGRCKAGTPIVCDDGDDCNGTEKCNTKTGKCEAEAAFTCPIAPSECNQSGGSGQATAGKVLSFTPTAGFRLRDLNQWNTNNQIIDQIAAHPSASKVSLATLLGDLNRTGNRVNSISGISCLTRGYTWNSGDNGVAYWYPQGLGGSATATSNGRVDGKSVLVASWYHKPENDSSTSTNKGVRVSFVDISNSATWPYRHALLVEPVMQNGKPSYKPIPIHAGGLAWYKDWLYVPDTSKGYRVFDLNRILRVQTSDSNAVGYIASSDQYHGFGYKYVIPQVNLYTRCSGSCCARFSFAFLAVSAQSPSLLSGEYTNVNVRGRLHRWVLDPTTGKLVTKNRTAVATQILFPGVLKMQGGGIAGTRIWISSSQAKTTSPTSPGSLYSGLIGGSIATYRYPYPPEDLHLSHTNNLLWSQTENPNSRYIFAIDPTRLGSACP